ncbi:M14 family metallopeptidase [Mariniblastus sp.]|nr:M14 family metallopeptidase [Mariniblastus sp.]
MSKSFYSSTYEEARRRFIDSATSANATFTSYPLRAEDATSDEFTIDVAVHGPVDAPALVVSSGLHGVEGFLGSAIQLAILEEFESYNTQNIRWVFIHAINPFGFARLRRFNEDNVDLNRNFLLSGSMYAGAPADYARLDALLNPTTEPLGFEPFRLKAMWTIIRYGMEALQQCVAAGQYEYPRGIFFGGLKPSPAMEVLQENFEQWIGSTTKILHVDFHSGLGAFGKYKLMLTGSDQGQWYDRIFGSGSIESINDSAYQATGGMGQWLQHHFADRDYRFVTAEFGTYGPIRVLAAIRAENRAHHFGSEQSKIYQDAKRELMECFCPEDKSWRQQVVVAGLDILRRGGSGLSAVPSSAEN